MTTKEKVREVSVILRPDKKAGAPSIEVQVVLETNKTDRDTARYIVCWITAKLAKRRSYGSGYWDGVKQVDILLQNPVCCTTSTNLDFVSVPYRVGSHEQLEYITVSGITEKVA